MSEAIIISIIASIGGILAALVQKGRKENRDDHNVVANMLTIVREDLGIMNSKIDHIDDQVDKVEGKLEDHIIWHLNKETHRVKRKEK